jgi:mono/diheme cytochrome c family protein
MSRRRRGAAWIALAAAPLAVLFGADGGDSKIWNGVYTAAQAERGKENFIKSCSNCHNADLNGSVRAPSLRGERFLGNWGNGSANALFIKLRDSMPATYPDTVPEAIKIDILTYLLQVNGFPAGKTELKLDQAELEDIQIVRKGDQTVPNFALVRVVGCLTPGNGKNWTLTRTSELAVTKDDAPTPAALKEAETKTLGAGSFDLVSTAAFKPESHQGRKVEARGLLYRDSRHSLLNLTSLEDAGGSCGN